MAETEKKAKAPAKKTAAKKTAAKTPAAKKVHAAPSHQEIAELAKKYWAEGGHHDGHAEQDWLRAEQELTKKA